MKSQVRCVSWEEGRSGRNQNDDQNVGLEVAPAMIHNVAGDVRAGNCLVASTLRELQTRVSPATDPRPQQSPISISFLIGLSSAAPSPWTRVASAVRNAVQTLFWLHTVARPVRHKLGVPTALPTHRQPLLIPSLGFHQDELDEDLSEVSIFMFNGLQRFSA